MSGINLAKLFSLSFWTVSNPGDLSKTFEIVFLIMTILGYVLFAVAKSQERKSEKGGDRLMSLFWFKVARMFLTMTIFFTFIFFFRSETVPYLGGRYTFLVWGLVSIGWLVYLLVYYFRTMPKIKAKLNAPVQSEFVNKYAR